MDLTPRPPRITTVQDMTMARLNDHPVPVAQDHRYWRAPDYAPGAPETDQDQCGPAVLTVVAPIRLAVDDVAAVLFSSFCPYEDLDDDATVRELVADAVVNGGCRHLEDLRCRLGEQTTLTQEDPAYLAYCRQRATTVFTTDPTVSSAPCDGARWGVR